MYICFFFSMHVLPGCHKTGVWEHSAAVDFHIDYGMVDTPDPSKVTMVIIAHPEHYHIVGGTNCVITR